MTYIYFADCTIMMSLEHDSIIDISNKLWGLCTF